MSAAPSPAPELLVEGRYRLIERVADWGVGESWRARDTVDRARVTVKFLPLVAPGDTRTAGEFQSLARRLIKLRHRSVVETRAYGFFEGRPYLVQESLDGVSLAVGFARARTAMRLLAPGMLANILDRACEALEVAHGDARPLAHGGLTPASVVAALIDERLVVRVLDFGLVPLFGARLRHKAAGEYTAPELDDDPERFTPAGDIFALGSIVMEAITDRRTASGGVTATLGGLSAAVQRRDDVPAALMAVVSRATRLEPDGRYPTAKALHDALAATWSRPGDGAVEARVSVLADATPESWERYAKEATASSPGLAMFTSASTVAPVFAPAARPPEPAPARPTPRALPRTAEMSEMSAPGDPPPGARSFEETLAAPTPAAAPQRVQAPVVAPPPAAPEGLAATLVARPIQAPAGLAVAPAAAVISPARPAAPSRKTPGKGALLALGVVALLLACAALGWAFTR